MHLVTLVHEVLLVNACPFVILCKVIELNGVDVQFWIQESVKAFFEFEDLHMFAKAFLEIVD